MNKLHHALTITATADLMKFWNEIGAKPKINKIDKMLDMMKEGSCLRKMERWVAQADELQDVVVEKGLAEAIVNIVSKATCFQHFAYCSSMGKLQDGDAIVKKYGGYCWDCDPFMTWYLEIANLSWADVAYNPNCGVFNSEFLKTSPGCETITGVADWDDQIYPSAIEMAEFYGNGARKFAESENSEEQSWSLQSLCYAIHMLQDVCVPHHVLCTVCCDHVDFEGEMLSFWRRLYSDRRKDLRKKKFLEVQVGPNVEQLLAKELNSADTFTKIGKRLVDMTAKRLPAKDTVPSRNKIESRLLTVQAIAGTIKALDVFYQ